MRIESPLVGARISLDGIEATDTIDHYLRWMRDPEVLRGLEARFVEHSLDSLSRYIANMNTRDDALLLGICLTAKGDRGRRVHIGNIKLSIDPHHRRGSIGIIIGEKEQWGQGYATEAIELLSEYAFSTLGLAKLTAGCYDSIVGSVKAFVKAEFIIEGRRPRHYLDQGKWVDAVLLGRINPSYSDDDVGNT